MPLSFFSFFLLFFPLFLFQGGDGSVFSGGSSGKSKFFNVFDFCLINDVKEKLRNLISRSTIKKKRSTKKRERSSILFQNVE